MFSSKPNADADQVICKVQASLAGLVVVVSIESILVAKGDAA